MKNMQNEYLSDEDVNNEVTDDQAPRRVIRRPKRNLGCEFMEKSNTIFATNVN